jgi:hypothetical protein
VTDTKICEYQDFETHCREFDSSVMGGSDGHVCGEPKGHEGQHVCECGKEFGPVDQSSPSPTQDADELEGILRLLVYYGPEYDKSSEWIRNTTLFDALIGWAECGGGDPDEGICDDCREEYVTPWFAPNDLWNRVVPNRGGLFCPNCFLKRARKAGLNPTGWEIREEIVESVASASIPQPTPDTEHIAGLRGAISMCLGISLMDGAKRYGYTSRTPKG